MATQLVPYNTAMQLGSGFNSYTQTLCVDHAVVRDTDPLAEAQSIEPGKKEVAQSVTYKTSIVGKTTDVTDQMSINGAFNIKYDQLQVDGSGSFINTNKIKDSDVSIMVSVKVVNQVSYDHSLTKFQPITNIKEASTQHLVEVYGDSYISGWQEGGEFLAVISIKAKNRDEAQNIAADAKIAFTRNKNPPPESDKKELGIKVNATFNKIKNNLTAENEVSVSVTWTGGGQHLKPPEQDWDFDTMKDVALRFPDLCARTPMRTHALLTKYTALRSFYTTQTFDLPAYDKTGTYTNVLQEAYLDYKAILGAIQVLAFNVSEGTKALVVNPRSVKAVEQAKAITNKDLQAESDKPAKETSSGTDAESIEGSVVDVTGSVTRVPPKVVTPPPPAVEEAFAATIAGLEEARLQCRYMMNRIIQEIDNITIKPEIATDEKRPSPYLSPFLFKLLLPLGVDLPAESSQVAQAVAASKVDPDALASKFMGVAG
ncbi:Fc.00g080370.m01.CDS01 [Cosmosporella sp. VM-42]